MIGLIGQKCGMTRKFSDDGTSVPITILEVLPNAVTQIKTKNSDGYASLQLANGHRKPHRISKPLKGHLAKAKVGAVKKIKEFRLDENEKVNDKALSEIGLGEKITVNLFNLGQKVDITGVTKGRGFSGVIRRHHFACQDATHGNSLSHRAPGSIGQNQFPGRVFKGKKMAGQHGNKQRTAVNLEVVEIDEKRNLLMIKGAIPGSVGGTVIIKPTVKNSRRST